MQLAISRVASRLPLPIHLRALFSILGDAAPVNEWDRDGPAMMRNGKEQCYGI